MADVRNLSKTRHEFFNAHDLIDPSELPGKLSYQGVFKTLMVKFTAALIDMVVSKWSQKNAIK